MNDFVACRIDTSWDSCVITIIITVQKETNVLLDSCKHPNSQNFNLMVREELCNGTLGIWSEKKWDSNS